MIGFEQPAKSFGFSRNSHPLTISQENPFVQFFLLLHKHPNLFPKVTNGLVEFFIDAISKITGERDPYFLFHSLKMV